MALVAAPATTPDWDAGEMRRLFARAEGASRTPSLAAQNQALLAMASAAYRASPLDLARDFDAAAQRVLRRRVPDHPNVKAGQWLTALIRQFYADAAQRCKVLGRFSTDRRDRAYFERMARQAQVAADTLARELRLEVEGLKGYASPLPVVDGDPPYKFVSQARVGPNGAINVDGMDRIKFVGHRPPPDAERTPEGALSKLQAAFVFFNRSATSLGKYDRQWAKKKGHVQAVVPARFPAVYLNEIARAAQAANMRRLHVMTMTKRGSLRELAVDLRAVKRRKKKRAKQVEVTCADHISMAMCAQRIDYARQKGRPLWSSSAGASQ